MVSSSAKPKRWSGLNEEIFTAQSNPKSFQGSRFQGSLAQAVQETLLCPILERRLLSLYLHLEGSVASNLFSSQVTANEYVAAYLDTYFTTFGWDVTHLTNEQKLLMEPTKLFGGVTSVVQKLQRTRKHHKRQL